MVENYEIENVIMSPKAHTSATYESFISALEEREQINVINAQDKLGESIYVGELEMKILGPIGEYNSDDNNNPSVVIMARWGNTKVLLTGDAEKEAEKRLIVEYGARIPDIAWEVQNKVKTQVESMTGLKVVAVNVIVQGVNFPKDSKKNLEKKNEEDVENIEKE